MEFRRIPPLQRRKPPQRPHIQHRFHHGGAGGQPHHPVGHTHRLRDVVGHQQGGLALLPDDAPDVRRHRKAGLVVQRGKRLIQQQDLRAQQQGAGNGPRVDALVGHKMLVLGADDCVNIDLRQRIVGSIAPTGTDGVVHGSHWVTAGGTAVQLPALIKEPAAYQQPAKQQDAKNNEQALL